MRKLRFKKDNLPGFQVARLRFEPKFIWPHNYCIILWLVNRSVLSLLSFSSNSLPPLPFSLSEFSISWNLKSEDRAILLLWHECVTDSKCFLKKKKLETLNRFLPFPHPIWKWSPSLDSMTRYFLKLSLIWHQPLVLSWGTSGAFWFVLHLGFHLSRSTMSN